MLSRLVHKLFGRPTTEGPQTPLPAPPGRRLTDEELFKSGQLKQRAAWRELMQSSGAAAEIEALRDIHRGRRAFLLGNGPSLKQQDLGLLANEVTFVTNWFANHDDFDRIQPTYYCISSHEVFGGWKAQHPLLNRELKGAILAREWKSHHFFPLWARDAIRTDPEFSAHRSDFLIFERPKATIEERGGMTWDLHSNLDDGYTGIITFCLPLAYHMGIREVYLLGCDCDYQIKNEKEPKAYFYDFKKHTTSTSKFETLDRIWGPGGAIFSIYEIVKHEAEERGMRIFNATHGGLLEVFERASYESLLRP